MDFREDYIPVNINILKDGMNVDYSMYRESKGEYFLLCKDVVLTDELIDKFRQIIYPGNNIYIPSAQYTKITGQKFAPRNVYKKSAYFNTYSDVRNKTEKMFDKIVFENCVPQEVAEDLTTRVRKQIQTIEIANIIQCINSVRKVDEYLHTHCVNVALLNGIIGKWMKYDDESLAALVKTGLLHDIGKLKIPLELLNKPSRLTEKEFDIIMQHPIYSHELLINSGYTDERILYGVIQHHERVNGVGYPFGLNINEINEFAKITSISDVYDAMVTKRAYKEAHSPFEILAWFSEGCYSELDINYINIFLESMVEELKGKKVLLSDGKVGTVMFVHMMNFEYPIVQVEDEIVHTSKELQCVAMVNE